MSKFDAWFEAQHGKRPGWTESDESLQTAVRRGERARDTLDRQREWDARRESALYAWQARERAGEG